MGEVNTLRNSGITLESVLQPAAEERKTKIVCTIGPSCWSKEMLLNLIDAGMNVCRLNFSHGDHKVHANTLANIRAAAAERPKCNIAVLLDTKGPEIRTGFLENGSSIQLKKGSLVELTTDYEFKGNETKIACSYKSLCTSVKVGSTILCADGSLTMKVVEILEKSVMVEILNNGTLGERKNMNLPGIIVDLPTVTEKDKDDLVNFAVVHHVDYIAASFVRKASDITNIRNVLGPRGRQIKIIAKIENQEGLENFDEILAETDAIMVARGDLGMEIPAEKVFLAQKLMIRKCNVVGKPVVTATQMLESMIKAPRPTRAECTDVANAVLDGTDAVMLSGETAGGEYPIEAVNVMASICREAEGAINYPKLYLATRNTVNMARDSVPLDTPEAIASSAVKTTIDMGAKLLVVLTESGRTPRLVSKYRPQVPILVLTALPEIARQCEGLLRGCKAKVMGSMIGTNSILMRAAELGQDFGWVKPGDRLVAVHGMKDAVSGASNMLKVLVVPDGYTPDEDEEEDDDLQDLVA
uniref:Pyruvate kinase n=1 Tax=Mucochytrium quahogii TaxID=96639 RepID=A0A7S2R7I1_9STRA|mmetsp:Transcript_44371/g.71047  ORF Transcript_44371/g.71047 Transcript_44371/m.71047 type:complete len:527 (-) Transcript_44371:685-2265(-)